jgi:hypothetical protein
MRGTVIAVDPTEKDVLVRTDGGAQRRLDAPYVAEHLQHAYALTAHTIQGATWSGRGSSGVPRTSLATGPTPRSRARENQRSCSSSTPRPNGRLTARRSPTARVDRATGERSSNASRPPWVVVTTRTSPWTASTPSATVVQPPRARARPCLYRPPARGSAAGRARAGSRAHRPLPRAPRRPASRHAQRPGRGAACRRQCARTHRPARATGPRPGPAAFLGLDVDRVLASPTGLPCC